MTSRISISPMTVGQKSTLAVHKENIQGLEQRIAAAQQRQEIGKQKIAAADKKQLEAQQLTQQGEGMIAKGQQMKKEARAEIEGADKALEVIRADIKAARNTKAEGYQMFIDGVQKIQKVWMEKNGSAGIANEIQTIIDNLTVCKNNSLAGKPTDGVDYKQTILALQARMRQELSAK